MAIAKMILRNCVLRRCWWLYCVLLGMPLLIVVGLYLYFPTSTLSARCQSVGPRMECATYLSNFGQIVNILNSKNDVEEDDVRINSVDSAEIDTVIRPRNSSYFEMRFLFDEAFKTLKHIADNSIYNINVSASLLTSAVRSLPDTRPDACWMTQWPRDLPKASIIIPFYMEHWSALLRTLYSIYNRTELHLIEEIILVDDANEIAALGGPLRLYLSAMPKLLLLRTKKRQGLIRARLVGSWAARGDVLVILDAHVEVNADWLPPLLMEVAKDKQTIAIPALDHIDPNTMAYEAWPTADFGSFNWRLDFVWTTMSKELEARYRSGQPIPTPTLLGCAMAVDRTFWFSQGGYDEELSIWGGESLELSFRTWMCGGRLHIVPCSRVGHIFRFYLPYIFNEKIMYKNLQRVAEVWMDEYKKYYFQTTNKSYKFTASEQNSLRRRYELRTLLNCKNFSWYLENVAKMVKPPELSSLMFGRFKNVALKTCISTLPDSELLTLEACEVNPERHTFYFTEASMIQYNATACLAFANPGKLSLAVIGQCVTSDPGQKWLFNPLLPKQLKYLISATEATMAVGHFMSSHGQYQRCLQAVLYKGKPALIMQRCNMFLPAQYWLISNEVHNAVKIIDNLKDR